MTTQTNWLRHRGILVGAALAALAITSSAIAVWAVYRLPTPEQARGRDLMRWLVTRDLREETPATRRALVRQLELYLQDTSELSGAAAEMNDERRSVLEANVAVLLREWLSMEAERYEQSEASDRAALVDQQLRLVEQVSELATLWMRPTDNAQDSNPTFELVATVEQIVVAAPAEERPKLNQYLRALKVRWFATVDLSEFDKPSLATLVQHVENELRYGLTVSSTASEFDPVGSRQRWQNAELLAEIWFHRQTETYSRLPRAARGEYMQRFIADVTSWPMIQQQLEPAPLATSRLANPFGLLLNSRPLQAMKQMSAVERRVEVWILRAPKSSQRNMREFVADARAALRMKYLKQLVPGI